MTITQVKQTTTAQQNNDGMHKNQANYAKRILPIMSLTY